MFPSFDDRSANIYNALYYSRSVSGIHNEFIEGIFNTEKIPMAAGIQKHMFSDVLEESLGEDCSLDVVKTIHSQIRERVLIHKESKDPEYTYSIKTQEIDGSRYLLIPIGEGVEVNGIEIK